MVNVSRLASRPRDSYLEAALGVQTTGAGDAFMVGYATSRADGHDAITAARNASRLVAEMLDDRKRAAS